MKRSKMLDLLAKEILDKTNQSWEDSYNLAKSLLSLTEINGMLPPPVFNQLEQDYISEWEKDVS